MQRLTLTIPGHPDETPVSFASRLAARNFVSARELLHHFNYSFQKVSDGDPNTIEQLATLGGADFETLMSNAIRKRGAKFTFRGEQISISSGGVRRARVHVCPQCFKEDIDSSDLPPALAVYGRPEWLISCVRTCPKHSVALVEITSCDNHHEFHDFTRNVTPILPHIDRAIAHVKRRSPSALETYLLDRLHGRADHPWLDSFPVFAAATLTEIVGAVAAFGKRVNLKTLSEDDRYRAGNAGFDIVKAGADGIDQLMSKLKREYVPKKRGSMEGFRVVYGRLHTTLGYGLRHPAYDPVRAVMTNHILSNFPLGPGDELFGQPVRERRFHSIRTAHRAFGMHEARLRKLIEAEGLLPDPSMKNNEVLFDATIADRLFMREDDSLSMTEVTKYINTTRSIAECLREAGLIKRHKVGTVGMPEVFFRSELDHFLASLYQKAVVIIEKTPDMCDLVSIRKRAYASTAEAIQLIIDGRLTWVGRMTASHGIFGLLVRIDEVRSLYTQTEIPGVQPSYVAKQINIHSDAMTALLKMGGLKTVTVPHPISRRPISLVPLSEIEKFKAEYVTLRELARTRRKFMPTLLRELTTLGIKPAFDGLGISIFKRGDLPAADISSAVRDSS